MRSHRASACRLRRPWPPQPPPAAQVQASPGDGPVQAGSNGTAAADGGAKHGTGPKPVPPTLTPAEREAGRLKGLRLKAERKAICQQLCTGQMTLAEVLARNDQTAGGMRVVTVLKAIPGIGGATATRLMRAGGHRCRPPGRRAHRGAA